MENIGTDFQKAIDNIDEEKYIKTEKMLNDFFNEKYKEILSKRAKAALAHKNKKQIWWFDFLTDRDKYYGR